MIGEDDIVCRRVDDAADTKASDDDIMSDVTMKEAVDTGVPIRKMIRTKFLEMVMISRFPRKTKTPSFLTMVGRILLQL